MSIDMPRQPLAMFRESTVIVVSILIAFGLQAGWDTYNENRLEQMLLADLAIEIRANIAALDWAVSEQIARVEKLNQVIGEAGPDRTGLSAASMNVLLAEIVINPTFDPKTGVLDQLLQGGSQSLIQNTELRGRLSGLTASMSDYQSNQNSAFNITVHPYVWLNSGSILFQNEFLLLPIADSELGATVPWDNPPTASQVQALKTLAFVRALTSIAVVQAPPIRNELTAILDLIEASI